MPCITHETEQERREAARRHEQALTGPLHEEIDRLKAKLAERDAMLCGVLSALNDITIYSDHQPNFLLEDLMPRRYDGSQAGVSWYDVTAWWEDHQARDRQRREAEAATRAARRQQVLSKLTREERELLGIKE